MSSTNPAPSSATTAAKKAPVKKTAAKKSTATSVSAKLGDTVFVDTDPKYNNGATEAAATVVQVLNTKGDSRVNLKVHLDGDSELYLRNVVLTTRAKAKKLMENGERVAFSKPS